jgi:hypothetical protein
MSQELGRWLGIFVACVAFASPAAADGGAGVAGSSADADDASADAGMNPPDEDDPGSGCGCYWKDELSEGTAALGLPWVALLFARRATRKRS